MMVFQKTLARANETRSFRIEHVPEVGWQTTELADEHGRGRDSSGRGRSHNDENELNARMFVTQQHGMNQVFEIVRVGR